jgi:hypothetical protein
LFFGPSQRFPLQGYGRLRRLKPWGQTPNDLVGPGAQVCVALIPIHVPKDGMERGGTGGSMGEAQGLRHPHAVIASPCSARALAASATEHRTARQREDGRSRRAFASRLPQVLYHREHFNERTWMWYHQAPPLVRVVAHIGDAGQAKPHLEHNPLSLLGTCHAMPLLKLNDPALTLSLPSMLFRDRVYVLSYALIRLFS